MSVKKHTIRYNFMMNLVLTASNVLFPLITFPYASRILYAEGIGKVAFAASVANYFTMLASLGIPTYGIRECAKVKDDREKLSKLVQEIFIINSIATALTTVLYLCSIALIPRLQQDRALFLIEGINIVLNLFGVNWLYQALEQYDYITIRSLVFKTISIALLFIFVREKNQYAAYAFVSVFALAGSNVLNFLRLRRYITLKKNYKPKLRRHLKPILILFAQNVTTSIYTNLDIFMLGIMKTDADVGYYNAAVKIKVLLTTIVTSLGNVLLPRMSYYVERREREQFRVLMKKALKLTVFLSIFLCGFFIVSARDCILFLAGDGFLPAVSAMKLIMPSLIPIGLSGLIGVQILTPLNKEKYVLYSVMIGAVSDFLLNFSLIPQFGAAGAALATTIAETLVLFVQLFLGREIIEDSARGVPWIKYLLSMMTGTIPAGIFMIKSSLPVLLTLLLGGCLYLTGFSIILLVTKDDTLQDIMGK